MMRVTRDDLSGSRFERVVLADAQFERVDLTGAEFHAVDLTNARFRGVAMNGVRIRGVEMNGVEIYGEIVSLTINGVDIGPLVNAELDRRYPARAKMRPNDAAGCREAWDVIEQLWGDTVERARHMEPELLHASVDGEWTFIETLRHLVFATDAWIRRAILGDPSPWDPLDLPWDEMPDTPGVPRDRDARPTLDEILQLRRDRMATARDRHRRPDRRVAARPHRAGRRARVAASHQLPGARMRPVHPQRGMGTPPLRRARPRCVGRAALGSIATWPKKASLLLS